MIIIPCSQRRSCFDKLSTNGCSYPCKLFPVHPEPVEGRTLMDNPQLETVLRLAKSRHHLLCKAAQELSVGRSERDRKMANANIRERLNLAA